MDQSTATSSTFLDNGSIHHYYEVVGFNTVVFMLNDFTSDLTQNPRTTVRLLTAQRTEQPQHLSVFSQMHNERVPNQQALQVVSCFHSSTMEFFVAGGNQMSRLEVVRFGKNKDGRKTVTLVLPEWWK